MAPARKAEGLRPFEPTPFGRYTLLAPLARGGMAQIYLARASGVEGFQKLVVIKKILPQLAADSHFVDRFLDEGKIVVKLFHGSIAQVFDLGSEGDEYFLALEFVDGKDLRKLETRCRELGLPVPVPLALQIAARMLDALAYAHRKRDGDGSELNVIDRDVSPQNVLVSYEGEVKVIDFGLAKSAQSAARTAPSVVLGKFFYMAPEQAARGKVDKRTDVYAASVCLWELLAGRNPFEDVPHYALLSTVANPSIPSVATLRPDVPPVVEKIVARGVARDPDQRFQTAEDMRNAIQAALLDLAPESGPEALGDFVKARFEREYKNERRVLAYLMGQVTQSAANPGLAEGAGAAPEPPVDSPAPATEATQEFRTPDVGATPLGREVPRDVTVLFGTVDPLPNERSQDQPVGRVISDEIEVQLPSMEVSVEDLLQEMSVPVPVPEWVAVSLELSMEQPLPPPPAPGSHDSLEYVIPGATLPAQPPGGAGAGDREVSADPLEYLPSEVPGPKPRPKEDFERTVPRYPMPDFGDKDRDRDP